MPAHGQHTTISKRYGCLGVPCTSISSQLPLLKRAAPFDDPEWLFELKYDGYRSLAIIEHGRAQLLSRNGNPFASFSALAESISDSLPNVRAVIDGENLLPRYVVDHSSKI